jgi:hypothetical protein
MNLSRKKAARVLRGAHLDFDDVEDPRSRRGRRHAHPGLLTLLVVAFGTACKTLRDVEAFCEDLPQRARRAVGLKGTVSDTALYELLKRQVPDALPQVLAKQVKTALAKKQIRNDLFGCGVATIDGKQSWDGDEEAHPDCQTVEHQNGTTTYRLRAQRICLTSSSVRPCLYQDFIPGETNEMGWFPQVYAWLLENFRRSFEVLTYDAGACSAANAQVVVDSEKAYVFSVKENQPTLLKLARARLGSREDAGDASRVGEARTDDNARGKATTREVFRYALDQKEPEVSFPGACELWRVRQTVVERDDEDRELKRVVSERYFVTNRSFGADRSLQLVRLHWGVENGPNWAMDVVMGEDAGSPCQKGHGLENVSWLRLLTTNLLALVRARLPRAHGEAPSYRDAGRALKKALEQALPPEDLLAQLA